LLENDCNPSIKSGVLQANGKCLTGYNYVNGDLHLPKMNQ